ncbi:beta-ketoacyl synthase, partial [Streptomyces viridochromogenes]
MLRADLVRPLHELLRTQSERHGRNVAFRDDRRSLSYEALETRSRRLAGHLSDLRVHPGDRAAMLLGNRVEMVESYFAIARSGAIGVPLNPRSTDAELAYLLQDSGARVLVTDAYHLDQVRRLQPSLPPLTVLVVGDDPVPTGFLAYESLATSEPTAPAYDNLGLDEIAWMLYTSGTTGRPKGVLSTTRNCLWSVAACYAPVLELSPEDRVLWPLPLFHSLSHIACVLSVTAVGAGARIVDGLSPQDVLDIWENEDFTVVAGVPTMYHHLVREARARDFTPPGLRIGLVGGAITTAALRNSVEEVFGAPLIDAYGSTETCGSITVNWPTGTRVEGSCGLPVVGLGVRLVDPETGMDVPDGVEGEVWVRGPSVMAGYYNQPEATAEAMKDGWYRTGDLARRDDAGYFTVTGRIKELIIRAGENIHPVEVEDVLKTVPGVADAAVAGRPHEVLGEVPVAFVVPGPEGFDPAEALAVCRERMSSFKVPAELYEIRDVPRTASGKVTRLQLLDVPARLRAVGDTDQESLRRVDWVPQPPAPAPSGTAVWAVVGEETAALAADLEAAGIEVRAYPDPGALTAGLAAGEPVPQVTVLAAPAGDTDAELVRAGVDRCAAWAENCLADGRLTGSPLLVTTRNAVVTGPEDRADVPERAPLWGLLRSLGNTHAGRLVAADLDEGPCAEALLAALATGESHFAVRSGRVLLPRLVRVAMDTARDAATAFADGDRAGDRDRDRDGEGDRDGTVVVTGAGAPRGSALAQHLVDTYGVGRLLLIASPGDGGLAAECRDRLVAAGANVVLTECDLADRAGLRKALAKAPGPIRAVVYGAGPEARPDMLAPLITGLHNLHELTRASAPSCFVLCSSTAAVTGREDPHTAVYAAFLDAFAHHLLALGVPALSLGWDADDVLPAPDRRRELAAFDAALTVDHPQLSVVRSASDYDTELASALDDTSVDRPTPTTHGTQTLAAARGDWDRLPERDRERRLVDLVREKAAELLAVPTDTIASDRAFRELGFTSANAVQLRNLLSEATGLRLPPTSAFDHPTPRALGRRLHRELYGTGEEPEQPALRAAPPAEPIAIVGMACRYPGDVSSPEELWRLLADESDAVTEFPRDRGWNLDALFHPDPDRPGTSHTREGGFLRDADQFDAAFFGISPREALAMDPQQRLMLEITWEALERAAIDPATLREQPVGVFTGAMHQDYAPGAAHSAAAEGVEAYLLTGGAESVLSGRVSYFLGLEGPAVTLDTACSSSLVALHWAAQSLRSGESSLALAGGVTVMTTPDAFVGFSRQRGLAPDGRCKSFAGAADGTGWAEGAGVLVLERLSDAVRNGRRIWGVVRGSAVNQDGA